MNYIYVIEKRKKLIDIKTTIIIIIIIFHPYQKWNRDRMNRYKTTIIIVIIIIIIIIIVPGHVRPCGLSWQGTAW